MSENEVEESNIKEPKSKKQAPEHTPLMEQYFAIKEKHPGYLLFFRLGDFYEMFFDDAKNASQALDIALTKRGREKGQDIPMCGVPVHSYEMYLSRLIKKGFKIAICEQTEDPEEARKQRGPSALINRDVIRLITPGTITEDNILDSSSANYLASITKTKDGIGVSWADISTGLFAVQTLPDDRASSISAFISKIEPKEIIISDKVLDAQEYFEAFNEVKRILTPQSHVRFFPENGAERLKKFFNVSTLDAFGDFNSCELGAAGALLDYVELTQQGLNPKLNPIKKYTSNQFMEIDAATRRNLELFHSLSQEKSSSVFDTINKTKTAAGSRLLFRYLSMPLLDKNKINERLDRIDFFYHNDDIRNKLRELLLCCCDIQRAMMRMSVGRNGPRDLAMLRDTLLVLPEIKSCCETYVGAPKSIIDTLAQILTLPQSSVLSDLALKLKNALAQDLPLLARDGGFIATGFNQELDEIRQLRDNSRQTILSLQAKYAEISGIPNLKIAHNNLLGFYIEVSAKLGNDMLEQSRQGKSIFLHRQTMSNAIRFTTVELSELENKVKASAQNALNLELQLFSELTNDCLALCREIDGAANAIATLDVASSLAQLALDNNYVRPIIDESLDFEIIKGRHIVVEQKLKQNHCDFIANNCQLGSEENKGKGERLWLITGPNMAGKSTFLRQNALIVILAQAGFFVPAQKARIGVADKVFSRVGASDDLATGRSTFMVEMIETAAILNQATPRSIVILDEIGRGTATFDGLSIAWAVAEYLHNVNKSRAMFATHYHELTALTEILPHVSLYTMAVKEWRSNVVFLHEVIEGAGDRSYGIHVGRLAGLPKTVIARANQVLEQLEKRGATDISFLNDLPLFSMLAAKTKQEEVQEINEEPQLPEYAQELIDSINNIDPDALSPKQALEELYKLKELVK